jgi:hypothetical protein
LGGGATAGRVGGAGSPDRGRRHRVRPLTI